jgi:hypothetical protein
MSQNAALPKQSLLPSNDNSRKMPLTPAMAIGIAGLFLFLSSQILIAAGAVVWAVGGYLHFGLTGITVLTAVLAPPVLYLCRKILVMAISAERDPANN